MMIIITFWSQDGFVKPALRFRMAHGHPIFVIFKIYREV